jgi:hypothetical protein
MLYKDEVQFKMRYPLPSRSRIMVVSSRFYFTGIIWSVYLLTLAKQISNHWYYLEVGRPPECLNCY